MRGRDWKGVRGKRRKNRGKERKQKRREKKAGRKEGSKRERGVKKRKQEGREDVGREGGNQGGTKETNRLEGTRKSGNKCKGRNGDRECVGQRGQGCSSRGVVRGQVRGCDSPVTGRTPAGGVLLLTRRTTEKVSGAAADSGSAAGELRYCNTSDKEAFPHCTCKHKWIKTTICGSLTDKVENITGCRWGGCLGQIC